MTATEKKIYEMSKGIEHLGLEELMLLCHQNYYFQFWDNADIEIQFEDNEWVLTEMNRNFKTYGESIHACYEGFYEYILNALFAEELEKEEAELEERERKFQERERMEIDKLYQDKGCLC